MYDLQYTSLKAKEEELQWIIDTNAVVAEVQYKQRAKGEYNEDALAHDVNYTDIELSDIQSQL